MQSKLYDTNLLCSQHWNGEEYRKISSPQNDINNTFLNAHFFRGDEAVLDIGCGDGTTTRKILEKVPYGSVIGIDASASMIEAAIQLPDSHALSFQMINAQELRFTQQFNLITCFFCLQWVQDKPIVFQKVYQGLKPNGQFIMIAPLPHAVLPRIRHELISSSRWKKYFTHYKDPLVYINDIDYEKYAEEAGLITSEFRVDIVPIRFSNRIEFRHFMCQMTPHCSCLPDENEINLFMHALLEAYFKIYPIAEDGSCELTFDLVKLVAYRPN